MFLTELPPMQVYPFLKSAKTRTTQKRFSLMVRNFHISMIHFKFRTKTTHMTRNVIYMSFMTTYL